MNKIEKIYSDIRNPAGLSSVKKLYKAVNESGNKTSLKEVEDFLSSQPSYTLLKENPRKFRRRKYIFRKPGHTLVGDIAFLPQYKKENKPYLLVLLDGYSRYVNVFQINSLKSKEVSPIVDSFFESNIYKYEKFFTDEGNEFINKDISKIYKKHGIIRYHTFNKEIKCSLVERFIRTLKRKIVKFVTHFNDENYTNVLEDIIATYNCTPHSSLDGRSPLDIHLMYKWEDIKRFSKLLYKDNKQNQNLVRKKLAPGTVVRLKGIKNQFSRSFHIQNTYELFKVKKVNLNHIPITYSIVDLEGNKIDGIFYHQELIKVSNSGFFEIKVVDKRVRKGKKEFLVEYVNYPMSERQWIKKSQIKKI